MKQRRPRPRRPGKGTTALGTSSLGGRTVLVAEDHEDTRDLILYILVQLGATVIARPDAMQAIAAMDRSPIDLVISDIAMSDDGHNVARAARERRIPVLALTGRGMKHEIAQASSAGFDRVLVKPVDPVSLCRNALDLAGRVRAA